MFTKLRASVFCIACAASAFVATLLASPKDIYAEAKNSISITTAASNHDDVLVSGLELTIYQITSGNQEHSKPIEQLTDTKYTSDWLYAHLDSDGSTDVYQYLTANKIDKTATKETDHSGHLTFDGLEDGIYLICQTTSQEKFNKLGYSFEMNPFLISLEGESDLSCTPKGILTEIKNQTPTASNQNNEQNQPDNTQRSGWESKTGAINVALIDDKTGSPLPNGVFLLYTTDGDLIGTYTTDQNGWFQVKYLQYQSYRIVQKSAPDGYSKMTSGYVFELTEDKSYSIDFPWNIKLTNTKQNSTLNSDSSHSSNNNTTNTDNQTNSSTNGTQTDSENESVPQTGDHSPLVCLTVGVVFCTALIILNRRKRGN